MEATASDPNKLGGKSCNTEEGVAAVSSQKVHGRSSSRAINREMPRGTAEGSQYSGQPTDKPWVSSGRTVQKRVCSRCGSTHRPRQCPAYGKQCMKCGGVNHFARVCRSSSQDTNLVQSEGVTKEEEECVLGDSEEEVMLISVEKVGKKLLANVEIQVGGSKRSLVCKLDTAASCNVLAWRDYVKLRKPKLLGSTTRLTMYDGIVKSSLGQCRLSVKNQENKIVELEFELLKTQQHSLLSLDTCLELQLLTYETVSLHGRSKSLGN